jgi:hypothetical protein
MKGSPPIYNFLHSKIDFNPLLVAKIINDLLESIFQIYFVE